jgi:TorA maturation chaperone TorD
VEEDVMRREDRAALYRLLAQGLAYPDPHFVRNLRTSIGKLGLVFLEDPSLPLSAFMQELGKLAALPLDQVQGEHTRLFINAYPRVPCPPYESVYREGELLGDVADRVALEYCRWGLLSGEHVDHAGAELEFLAFLLTLGTFESLAAADRFLKEHVLRWMPTWAEDLVLASQLGFYRAAGELTASVLRGSPRDGGHVGESP